MRVGLMLGEEPWRRAVCGSQVLVPTVAGGMGTTDNSRVSVLYRTFALFRTDWMPLCFRPLPAQSHHLYTLVALHNSWVEQATV